jgi:hypothetical protein
VTRIFDAVTFCVTLSEPVMIALPLTSKVEFAVDLFIPTPTPASKIELVVSVVAPLNFVT